MQLFNWQKSCLLAAVAFLGGAGGMRMYEQSACPTLPLRLQDVACVANAAEPMALPELEAEVRAIIEGKEKAGKLMRAGALFQRLNDGSGFSLGEEHAFVPASLLKLPVAFSIFQLESQEPGTLHLELPYSLEQAAGCEVLSQDEVSTTGLERGQHYTVERMLRAVIVQSDNLSYCILIRHMNTDADRRALLQRTFRELGIQDPANIENEVATVREYAGLFRLLYNTAYLDADGSEKLLGWLSEASYDKGLEAGVPAAIRVANKFAERVTDDETRYLHDCGIIYAGENSFVLCIMTKGRNFAELQATITEVSSRVYSAVTAGTP